MSTERHKTIYLKDYIPPSYLVSTVDLCFELDETATLVHSRLRMRRNKQVADEASPLELNGEHLKLNSVSLDGRTLSDDEFVYDGRMLSVTQTPDQFTLEVETMINPKENTALEGLYLSSGNFCTQCEAEGFRRITCYPDRPDVMAEFTTTIIVDQDKYPVLLSNGNLTEEGVLEDGRHFATWNDPYRKPCYLFALVAGDLVFLEDLFQTRSGKDIILRIYVEKQNREKCAHAMASLKKAMRWDEDVFGLEYDLDVFMIVAVDDFNMGAMENKGLNVFNSKYVLALPETATDSDYEGIEGVIAHEYFHNWTGDRVTCRDWFQLSLKEGLTVFRDQEFSADMTSRPVKRIHDVQVIRNFQFREDAGPMAHSVRPESYMEINNFYTLTVYDKGAEVIRMLHTLLGPEGFRRGMDLYFQRHDGQAVTCDDFVAAMADANHFDAAQFKLWYSQAGTPELEVKEDYNPEKREYVLTVRQSCPPTPGQDQKKPLLIPVGVGLLDGRGCDMKICLPNVRRDAEGTTAMLHLMKEEERFVFQEVPEKPVLSFLRNFSAPVKVKLNRPDEDLAFLMAHDSDAFNRWDAGQQLALKYLLQQIVRYQKGEPTVVPDLFVSSFGRILTDEQADPAFLALTLTLPLEHWIGQQMEVIDPAAVFAVRQFFRRQLRRRLRDQFLEVYNRTGSAAPYHYSAEESGRRSLRNTCLGYLLTPDEDNRLSAELLDMGKNQYYESDNMTDTMAALSAVVNADSDAGNDLLADFYKKWRHDSLIVDKWLTLQATCTLSGAIDRVKALTGHPAFVLKNPNKVRALIGAFCSANQVRFHETGGEGYVFLADYVIRLDSMNSQIAARLLTPLITWRRYDQTRQDMMRSQLERIQATKNLSGEVNEVVSKSLA